MWLFFLNNTMDHSSRCLGGKLNGALNWSSTGVIIAHAGIGSRTAETANIGKIMKNK